jgi:hypothetical protein
VLCRLANGLPFILLQAVYDQLRGAKNALRKLMGKRVGSACLLLPPLLPLLQMVAACPATPASAGPPLLANLQPCLLTQACMQRHTAEDLGHFQGLLEKIDAARTDGVFCGDLEASLPAAAADSCHCRCWC